MIQKFRNCCYCPDHRRRHHGFITRAVLCALCIIAAAPTAAPEAQIAPCPEFPYGAYRVDDDNSKCAWECLPQFFKLQTDACKPCSRNLACPKGTMFIPCSRTTDARCATCTNLGPNQALFSNVSCADVQCIEGFYRTSPTTALLACSLCPLGSYCTESAKRACAGTDEATLSEGTSSVFQCKPRNIRLRKNVLLKIKIQANLASAVGGSTTTNTYDDFQSNQCYNFPHLLSWIPYGDVQDCKLEVVYSNGLTGLGTSLEGLISCFATVANSVKGTYINWLRKYANEKRDAIRTNLMDCFAVSPIFVSTVEVVATPSAMMLSEENAYLSHSPLQSPDLLSTLMGGKWWGSTNADVQLTVGVLAALCVLSCSSCICVTCMYCALKRHKSSYFESLKTIVTVHGLDEEEGQGG